MYMEEKRHDDFDCYKCTSVYNIVGVRFDIYSL